MKDRPLPVPLLWLALPCGLLPMLSGGCAGVRLGPGARPGQLAPDVDPNVAQTPLSAILRDVEIPASVAPATTEPSRQTTRRLENARQLIRQQRYTEAISQLEKGLRYDPNHAPTYRLLGMTCRRSGSTGRAGGYLAKCLRLDPEDAAARYHRAMVLAEGDQQEECLAELKRAWVCPARAGDALYRALIAWELGRRLEQRDYLVAALALYDRVLTVRREWVSSALNDPDELELVTITPAAIALRTAKTCERLGRLNDAADAMREVLAAEPQDVEALSWYARLLLRLKRPDEARRLARMLLGRASTAEDWDRIRSLYALSGGDEGFLADLRELAEQEQPAPGVLDTLFETLRQAGDHAGAERALRRLIEEHGDVRQAYRRAVDYYVARDDPHGALELLAQACQRRPEDIERVEGVLDGLAADAADLERLLSPPAAREDDAATDDYLHYLLAAVANRHDRRALAIEYLEQVIRRHPSFARAYVLRAQIELQPYNWDGALEWTAKALEAAEETAALARVRATAHDGLDEFEQAEAGYARAIALDRDDTTSMYRLGRMVERMGEPLRARREYQAILAVNPRDARAHEALVANFFAQGEGRLARDQIERMREELDSSPALARVEAQWDFQYEASTSRRPRREIAEEYCARLEEIADGHPEDQRTLLDLAEARLFVLRDYARGEEILRQMKEIEPELDERDALLVHADEKLLKFEEAAERLRRMLERHPRRAAWKLSLARMYSLAQDYGREIEVYEELLDDPGPQIDVYQLRRFYISACCRARKTDQAVRAVADWQEEDTLPDPSLRRDLIGDLLEADAAAEAVAQAEAWYADAPQDDLARISVWAALYTDKQYDRALLLLLEWLEDDPENDGLNRYVVDLLAAQGNLAAAVELARNAAVIAGPHAAVERLRRLAALLLVDGRHEEAIQLYRRIARSSMDLRDALQVANGMIQAKWYDEAERHLTTLLESRRGGSMLEAQVHYRRSYCYQLAGQQHLARQEQERILELLQDVPYETSMPGELEALYFGTCNDLGYMLADAGVELERAERLIRTALSYLPGQAAYLDSLGWVEYKQGDFAAAAKWLERAARAGRPPDAIIIDHLGDAYWRLERGDDAVESWTRVRRMLRERQEQGEELLPEDEAALENVNEKLDAAQQQAEPPVSVVVGG